MKPSKLGVALAVSLAVCGACSAAINPQYKQLAGPPSEFDAMRPVGIGAAAIVSKSALIPLQLAPDARHGRSWSGTLPVENGHAHFMVLSGDGSPLQVELRSPDGKPAPLSRDSDAARAAFGIESAAYQGDVYSLDGVRSGNWNISVHSDGKGAGRGFLLMEGDPATRLVSWPSHNRQWVGQRMQIAAVLSHAGADGSSQLGKAAGTIVRAVLRVTAPDGSQREYPMVDDGRHGDGLANDGTYGGEFEASQAGDYLASVETESVGRNGERQLRSAEHIVSIVQPTLKMAAARAMGIASTTGRLEIAIPATETGSPGHYRAYAEVWGTNAAGLSVPVAWISGMTERSGAGFPLGLDQRWIARANARAPFELRNVRVEDPDHFITIASAGRIALSLPPIPPARASQTVPDEAMTMGPRPRQNSSTQATTMGSGSRLLLVHGYCSSLVWPASQFSNASVFSDPNANRSNDQFARLILAFGSTWNDYGIVAHSQGGLASLHLYTYYWSGLDYVTSGSRLIQSVGSPYQGTNIAGILATIGSWFGVGCGSNSDLTYSGASAWLAGIPTAERAKVNYYTTSFTDHAWQWDYCNAATDLVLSDPDDGVTEKVNDQLPGGTNRGHVTGECHTTGMRDPAQYLDSSRNATMNANAAR
ncbi:MAG TPA: choice-of-anchor X domain-containing protein [Xanthomonadaceae bacterium]|jgi:hypothetical protein